MADRAELLATLRARVGTPRAPARPQTWFRGRGRDVEYLQRRLEVHGVYQVADGDEYGLFGRATEQAVRAFQSSHDLRCDAVVGAATWQALDREPA